MQTQHSTNTSWDSAEVAQHLKERCACCRRLFLLVRGIFGFGAIGNYLFAVTLLPLNDTLVLTFTAPIWASVLGPFIIVKEAASK